MYGEFNRGRSSLQDEFREGRPKSVVVQENIDAVRQLILQDCLTYREIETTLSISGTNIHSILHEHLTVKKICSRWIPHKINQSEWQKCFDNWFKRMQKCMDLNGEYYEEQ